MHKGQFPKLKGSICNILVNTSDIINALSDSADSNGLVVVKLKQKLSYRGHVYFEAMHPESVHMALKYLKENNPLYRDIHIDVNNVPNELTDAIQYNKQNSSSNYKDPRDGLEEDENPLDSYRFNSQETMFVPTIFSEEISIAPGEGKQPTSLLSDDHCEELVLVFPYLFPERKFSYKPTRVLKLSPVKCFNQRLLNYSQMLASDSDYIFYGLSVTQQLKINSEINTGHTKICTGIVTAGMMSQSFSETVQSFLGKDEAYSFMNTIKKFGKNFYMKFWLWLSNLDSQHFL